MPSCLICGPILNCCQLPTIIFQFAFVLEYVCLPWRTSDTTSLHPYCCNVYKNSSYQISWQRKTTIGAQIEIRYLFVIDAGCSFYHLFNIFFVVLRLFVHFNISIWLVVWLFLFYFFSILNIWAYFLCTRLTIFNSYLIFFSHSIRSSSFIACTLIHFVLSCLLICLQSELLAATTPFFSSPTFLGRALIEF